MSSVSFQAVVNRADLTPQQLSSKTLQQLLGAALGDEVDSVKTADAECERIGKQYDGIQSRVDKAQGRIASLDRQLESLGRKVTETQAAIDAQVDFLDDKPSRTGVMTYREILKATVDVFGAENMTEAVICQAIVEAGYGAWRSMSGPTGSKVDDALRGAVSCKKKRRRSNDDDIEGIVL